MLVQDWMHKNVITVGMDEKVRRAVELFTEHNTSMLPVVGGEKLMGILTPKDLKTASISENFPSSLQNIPDEILDLKVSDVMSREPLAVPPDFSVEETAELLLDKRIPGCPVLDRQGRIVGIVTKRDLLKAFVVTSGAGRLGILFGFMVKDQPDEIRDLYDVIRKYDAMACSIMSCYANAPEGYRYLQIRALKINRHKLDELKKELRQKARLLFVVDRRENRREVYSVDEDAAT